MKLRSMWLRLGRVVSVTFCKASMRDASPSEFVIANAGDQGSPLHSTPLLSSIPTPSHLDVSSYSIIPKLGYCYKTPYTPSLRVSMMRIHPQGLQLGKERIPSKAMQRKLCPTYSMAN
jgi:hypothetical protein